MKLLHSIRCRRNIDMYMDSIFFFPLEITEALPRLIDDAGIAQIFQFWMNNGVPKNYPQDGCRVWSQWEMNTVGKPIQVLSWHIFVAILTNFTAMHSCWKNMVPPVHSREQTTLHIVSFLMQTRRRRWKQ